MTGIDFEKLYSGEHLKKINPNWKFASWSYRHSFVAKMKHITSFLSTVSKDAKILDAGCGQGLLVNWCKERGHDIIGVDTFYGGELVKQEDILQTGFEADSFDVILCLDVIEHFGLLEQHKLIAELKRVLKPGGVIVWSIPNMGNLSSRVSFLLIGRLLRTARVSYHPGDRPIYEYCQLLKDEGLEITKKNGISATIPGFFQLTQLWPQYFGWLYFLLKPFQIIPNWCFNVVVYVTKK